MYQRDNAPKHSTRSSLILIPLPTQSIGALGNHDSPECSEPAAGEMHCALHTGCPRTSASKRNRMTEAPSPTEATRKINLLSNHLKHTQALQSFEQDCAGGNDNSAFPPG